LLLFVLDNKKYLTSANAEQKKVLDLGQCGDFTVLAKQELRGINSISGFMLAK